VRVAGDARLPHGKFEERAPLRALEPRQQAIDDADVRDRAGDVEVELLASSRLPRIEPETANARLARQTLVETLRPRAFCFAFSNQCPKPAPFLAMLRAAEMIRGRAAVPEGHPTSAAQVASHHFPAQIYNAIHTVEGVHVM